MVGERERGRGEEGDRWRKRGSRWNIA